MNKRTFLLIAVVLVVVSAGIGSARGQQPTPAAAPAVAAPALSTPQSAPAAPTAAPPQKPATTPPPAAATAASTNTSAVTGDNVRFDVTISDQTASAAPIKKVMTLVVNRIGSIRSGFNVPMTQSTLGAMAPGGLNTVPITTYSYRTMGLSLDVSNVWVERAGGDIHARVSIEYNPIDEAEKTVSESAHPSYSNFSQSFELTLQNGKPVLAAQTSDPVPNRNRTLSVEVKATIVK